MRLRDIVRPQEVYLLAIEDILSIKSGGETVCRMIKEKQNAQDASEWAKMISAIAEKQADGMFRLACYIDEILRRKEVV